MPLISSDNTSSRENAVRDYYDHNTQLFLKLGQHARSGGIHQPLYLEDNEKVETAIHGQHRLLLEEIGRLDEAPEHILDLGCGVGASMHFMSHHLPKETKFTGLTISRAQVDRGKHLFEDEGERIRLIEGSYLDIPASVGQADVIYAIESFVHAEKADTFFSEAAKHLSAGGSFVLFDDFLVADIEEDTTMQAFREGWKANALLTEESVTNVASEYDLVKSSSRDLTAHLDLWRWRDRFVHFVQPFLGILPISPQYRIFLRGGNARQQLYKRGLLCYKMIKFKRRDEQ